jgi:hypothetical protein
LWITLSQVWFHVQIGGLEAMNFQFQTEYIEALRTGFTALQSASAVERKSRAQRMQQQQKVQTGCGILSESVNDPLSQVV